VGRPYLPWLCLLLALILELAVTRPASASWAETPAPKPAFAPSEFQAPTGTLHACPRDLHLHWRDPASGYELVLGCRKKRDPAGFVDGPNLYAYVSNRPTVAVDPSGLKIVVIQGSSSLLNQDSEVDWVSGSGLIAEDLKARYPDQDVELILPDSAPAVPRPPCGEKAIIIGYSQGAVAAVGLANSWVGFSSPTQRRLGPGPGFRAVDLLFTIDPVSATTAFLWSKTSIRIGPFHYSVGHNVSRVRNIYQNNSIGTNWPGTEVLGGLSNTNSLYNVFRGNDEGPNQNERVRHRNIDESAFVRRELLSEVGRALAER